MCRGARQMIADWRKCMTQSIRRYRASDDEQRFQVLVRNIIKSHLVLLYCFILLLFRNDATSVISLMHHYIYIYIWGGVNIFFFSSISGHVLVMMNFLSGLLHGVTAVSCAPDRVESEMPELLTPIAAPNE